MLRVKSENSHIYQAKEKRCIFDVLVWLWQQSWHLRILMLLNELAKLLIEEPCSLFSDFTPLSSYIITDMVKEFAVLGSKYCPVCKLCYFTIHLDLHSLELQTVSLQSHGLIFRLNPSRMAGKYIFYDVICHFHLILASFNKKCQNMEKENKHKWTHHSRIPLMNNHFLKTNLAPENIALT